MKHASSSVRAYTLTFGGLLFLASATTLIGFLNLGPFSMVIAIAIAAAKAGLIAGIFMNALNESKVVRVAIAGGVIWFLIMVSLTVLDYISRGWVIKLSGK